MSGDTEIPEEGRTGSCAERRPDFRSPKSEENAIQARRRRRQKPTAGTPVAQSPATSGRPTERPAPPGPTTKSSLTESDPWTVPASVRDRFVQEGNRFYFPDGAMAFRDLGRKLTTTSENTQVVQSLIEIARARAWSEVKITGSERFREEAWRQARLAGLAVRGYQPTSAEQAQVIRTLARGLARSGNANAERGAEAPTPSAPPAPSFASDSVSRSRLAAPERISGTLLRHGRAPYRHDAREGPSYFVRLQTHEGPREIWGRDIERALGKSLTQPQIGDDIVLQRVGRDPVTVRRRAEHDEGGRVSLEPVAAFRTRWRIEKASFFDERKAAADLVRNEAVTPQEGVRASPELTSTYLGIRAAELVANKALQRVEDRRRFVAKVREALAWRLERGDPPPVIKLRNRSPLHHRAAPRAPDSPEIAR